jgi:hypothetical protein
LHCQIFASYTDAIQKNNKEPTSIPMIRKKIQDTLRNCSDRLGGRAKRIRLSTSSQSSSTKRCITSISSSPEQSDESENDASNE